MLPRGCPPSAVRRWPHTDSEAICLAYACTIIRSLALVLSARRHGLQNRRGAVSDHPTFWICSLVSLAHDSIFSRGKSETSDAGPFAILLLVDVDVGIVESGVMDAFDFVLDCFRHTSRRRALLDRVFHLFFSLLFTLRGMIRNTRICYRRPLSWFLDQASVEYAGRAR